MQNPKYHVQILMAFLLLIFISCSKDSDNTPSNSNGNIDQFINSNSQYSLFAHAVKKTGIEIFTKGGGPYTFFVPTNDALSAITINGTLLNSVSAIDQVDSIALTVLIINHFRSGNTSYPEIPAGPNASNTMQGGSVVYATKNTKGAFLNGVKLLDQGTPLSNGYVYGLSGVLIPNYANPLSYLSALSNYKLMLQAIAKTSNTASFTTNPTTIFAIPNSIMIENGYDSTAIANLTGTGLTQLSNILRYHTIPNRVYAGDWQNVEYPTRLGKTPTIVVTTTDNSILLKGKSNTSTFTLPAINISTSTGVVYFLNGMLKP